MIILLYAPFLWLVALVGLYKGRWMFEYISTNTPLMDSDDATWNWFCWSVILHF